jgi:UDP-N-acetylmuramoyl-L-alanyl-D-glutamate--2,6-diaminopimelate ligase
VTSDNPRNEPPDAIVRDILKGFHAPKRARLIADRAAAIAWALGQANEGDCVLIAGRGHETHQIVGHQRIPLDDREAARQWLRSRWLPTRQRAEV